MDNFREKYKFNPESIRVILKTFLSDRVTKVVVLPGKGERIYYREEGSTGYVTVPEAQASAYTVVAEELNKEYSKKASLREYDEDIRKIFGEKIDIEKFEPHPKKAVPAKPNNNKRRFKFNPKNKTNKKALILALSYLLGIGAGTATTITTVNIVKDINMAKQYMEEIGTDDPRYAINTLISEMELNAEEKLESDLKAKDVDIIIGEGYSKDGDPETSKIIAKYGFTEKTYREFRVVAPKLKEFLKYARTHGKGHLSVAHLLKLREELLKEGLYQEERVGGFLTSDGDGIGVEER